MHAHSHIRKYTRYAPAYTHIHRHLCTYMHTHTYAGAYAKQNLCRCDVEESLTISHCIEDLI